MADRLVDVAAMLRSHIGDSGKRYTDVVYRLGQLKLQMDDLARAVAPPAKPRSWWSRLFR